jgi:hypothetical protein
MKYKAIYMPGLGSATNRSQILFGNGIVHEAVLQNIIICKIMHIKYNLISKCVPKYNLGTMTNPWIYL